MILSSVTATQEDLLNNCQHLDVLHLAFTVDMHLRSRVLDPFANADTEKLSNMEKERVELTTNEELKVKLKNLNQQFWLQKSILVLYSGL